MGGDTNCDWRTDMKRFRITFNDGPMGNLSEKVDIEAESMDEAMSMAYKMPQAKSIRYTDFTVEEIEDGPKSIGIKFTYHYIDTGKIYNQYMIIWANDEAHAIAYYNENIRGKRFYQPWPHKIDSNGNCMYDVVAETYFACGVGYDFNALTP